MDGIPDPQRVRLAGNAMENIVLVFIDIDDREIVDCAQVAALASAGRKKDGLIQGNQHLVFTRGNGANARVALSEINVFAE